MHMTNHRSTESTKPGIGYLHDPAAYAAPHFASVAVAVRIASGTGDQAPGLFPRTAYHCFNRRQQAAGEGGLPGRSRHAVTVSRIYRMHSKRARFDAQREPGCPVLRLGPGSNNPINSRCLSVTSFRSFFITEAQLPNRLKRKDLL